MLETPKGLRLHIAMLGRRNAGKSSLVNALSRQTVSIVSPNAGTTTDPVEKTIELPGFGPSVLVDTAGMDDEGELGAMRVERTRNILRRADLAVVVTEGQDWTETERELIQTLRQNKIPFVIARNKADIANALPPAALWKKEHDIPADADIIDISARNNTGTDLLLAALRKLLSDREAERPLYADLLPKDALVVFVAPIDTGAPKGRLILPQVQALRECLDYRQTAVLLTEAEYPAVWRKLAVKPNLVVCDSQVVKKVAGETPSDIPLTTFSILMARFKGDLLSLARGAAAIKNLRPGDSVCIQEACSHHPQEDDIGRVKIPALLKKLVGGNLNIVFAPGKEMTDLPDNLKVIIHCGGCVITRKQMLARQDAATQAGFPMTNYGMAISLAQGLIERALAPFPEALAAFEELVKEQPTRN